MRRRLMLWAAWLAAAVAATAIAWQGVSLVGDLVTDDRPSSLTAAEIEQAIADRVASPTTEPSDESGSTTTDNATAGEPAPVTRTYPLTGGTARLRFAPSGVTAEFAMPNAGYEVRSEARDGGGWRVEFDGPAGRSRVEGWWDGGPQERVDDDGVDDDAVDDNDDGGPGGGNSGEGSDSGSGGSDSGSSGPG
jgi:uncharacterized membrane protein YgcG